MLSEVSHWFFTLRNILLLHPAIRNMTKIFKYAELSTSYSPSNAVITKLCPANPASISLFGMGFEVDLSGVGGHRKCKCVVRKIYAVD
jgi:hypothetical protein